MYRHGRGGPQKRKNTSWQASNNQDDDPMSQDNDLEDCEDEEDYNRGDPTTIKPMPLGPFNEGVPTAFKSAIPGQYHRGILCQQPVAKTATIQPIADDDTLDIVTVMGQEVEELNSDYINPNKKSRARKRDHGIIDNRLRSRVNLPAMQFVNRDKREIDKLDTIRDRPLPASGSRNDLSDDEEADLRDFEVPLTDLVVDNLPLQTRLTGNVHGKAVISKDGAIACNNHRMAPKSFLHCHICDKRGFRSIVHYGDHLKGDMHLALRKLHVEKLQAGLNYLRAGAKKAEIRLAMGLLRSPEDPSPKMNNFCDVCGCNVLQFRLHLQLPQHLLVEKFIFPTCCGAKYRNRVEFEDHRTSPEHLREQFRGGLSLLGRLQGGKLKGDESYQSLPEYLRLLKSNCLVNDDDSTVNLTPYDPDRPNVIKMLKYYGVIQCMCCGDSFDRQQLEQLFEHVHSLAHYEQAVLYTTNRERETLRHIRSGKEKHPEGVRLAARKVVKVADALIEHGQEKAKAAEAAGGSTRVMEGPRNPSPDAVLPIIMAGGLPILGDHQQQQEPESDGESAKAEQLDDTEEIGENVDDLMDTEADPVVLVWDEDCDGLQEQGEDY